MRRCCNGTRLSAQIAGFFAGLVVGAWVPGGCGDFSPLLRFAGGDGRRDAPSLQRCCNGTRLPTQIAGIFFGVWRWRGAPSLRRCCNGARLPAQIAGIFLRGLAGGGGWVPGGCEGFSFLRRCCNGTRLPAQIAGFFAGLAGGGTNLLQRAGLRRKGGRMIADFMRCSGGGLLQGRRAGHFYDSITKAAVALLFGGCGVIII